MAKGSATIDISSLRSAGEPNKYITKIISGDGIKIHDSQNQDSNYIQLTSDGMRVYKNADKCFEATATELKASLTEAKDIFTVGYNSAIMNKTESQILNSNNDTLELTGIPFSTNFNLTFTIFFVGYSVISTKSLTFENLTIRSSFPYGVVLTQGTTWDQKAGYNGETLPAGGITIGLQQPEMNTKKQLTYNITINGGLTFDHAIVTAVWKDSNTEKDEVFLTFGSRENGISKGLFSTAMGLNVTAIGDYSHAEGCYTVASGDYSYTTGFGSQAIGTYSYAAGCGSKATIDYQTVFGRYNAEDSNAMFVVGNGTDSSNRSNLMTLGNNYVRIGSTDNTFINMNNEGLELLSSSASLFSINKSSKTGYAYTSQNYDLEVSYQSPQTIILPESPAINSTIQVNCSYRAFPPNTSFKFGETETIDRTAYTIQYDGDKTFIITYVNNDSETVHINRIKYAKLAVPGAELTLGSRINTPDPLSVGSTTNRVNGLNSTTLGTGLQAYTDNQLVIGQYNKGDSLVSVLNNSKAFIIGNGSIDNTTGVITESNALTVDWSGNITVSNHNSPIGTLLEESASGVSIASNTDWHYVTGCQVELTPGSWIVSYSVMCTTLASGKRLGGALKNPNNESIYYGSRTMMHASTSSAGAVSGVFPCIVTDDATSVKVRLMAFQTQGSSQDISGYIRAMRIV